MVRKTRFGLRPLHNLLVDLRFGGPCGGRFANPFAAQGAYPVQSTDYAVLTTLHQRHRIVIRESDVLVDVGCGPGRVINWWLSRGLTNRIVGLELVESIAAAARERLRRYPNVEIVGGDAIANLPAEGTFFYLYSPFDAPTMERFAQQLAARAARPTELRILYFNSRHVEVFQADPRWHVQRLETGEPEPAALISLAATGGAGPH